MSDERVYHLLFDKLWDDARRDVRLGVSQAFTALGLRNRFKSMKAVGAAGTRDF